MKNFPFVFKISMRIVSTLKAFIAFCLSMSLLISCSSYKSNGQTYDKGITFVTSPGSPPVDSITWSSVNDNLISVTAGDIGKGRAEVYMLDLETGQKQVIAKTDWGDFVSSTWAPDNKYILFSVRDNSKGYEPGGIWIYDTDKRSSEYFIDSGFAVWSPDNKTITTFSVVGINTNSMEIELNLINPTTKKKETIYTNNTAKYFWGLSWSSDGKNLVFGVGQDVPGNLYIINVNTRQTRQLTNNERASNPVWSPAGNIIAYENWPTEGTMGTLHLIESNGLCDIAIPNLEDVWSPTWSPDGKKLGYIGQNGIFSMDINRVLGRDIYQNLCQ